MIGLQDRQPEELLKVLARLVKQFAPNENGADTTDFM